MSDSMVRRRRREGGLTLLEVLAALGVFLVGILGILSLLTAGTRMHQQSQNMVAVADVVDEVEMLVEREMSLRPSLQGGLPQAPSEPTPVPGREFYSYMWSLRDVDPDPPYMLDLEIHWLQGSKLQTYEWTAVVPTLVPMARLVRRMKDGS